MRRVHWLLESRVGPRLSRWALRTRLGPEWTTVPTTALDVVHEIAPLPLLLVYGTADRYFGVEHSRALQRSAGPDATLWVVEAFGHAETAVDPVLAARIGRWIARTATGSGRVPAVTRTDDSAPDRPAEPTP